MPRDKVYSVKLSEEERTLLGERARAYNLPVSVLVRRMLLNERIPDPSNHRAVQALCRLHADCVDLMNLVRNRFLPLSNTELEAESLLGDIGDLMKSIREAVVELGNGRQPRPYRLAPGKMDRLVRSEEPEGAAGDRSPREPEP